MKTCVLTTQLSEYFILGFWGETFQLGGEEGAGESHGGPWQGLLVVLRALIKMTYSRRFCLESNKPVELAVVFTNTANYWVGFFLETRLQERWHGRFKYECCACLLGLP